MIAGILKKKTLYNLVDTGSIYSNLHFFSLGRKKSFTLASAAASVATSATQINSHIIMTNNAMFLLDLASASNSNLVNISKNSKAMTASILSSVSELGCMDPNPFPLVPFQVSLLS